MCLGISAQNRKKKQRKHSIYRILRAEEPVIKRNVKAKENWCKEKCQRKQKREQLLLNIRQVIRIISLTNFNAQFSLYINNMFVTLLSSTCFEH